jgi:hypothetical protein
VTGVAETRQFCYEILCEGCSGRAWKDTENCIKKSLRHTGYEDEKWIKLVLDRT